MLLDLAAEVVLADGLRWGLVAVVFLVGLRHGFDLDHIAAISDITSSQIDRKSALRLASFYATGHALVLILLGAAAVMFGARIPRSADALIGRVTGATLILLGFYVVHSVVVYRRDFVLRSRWLLALSTVRRTLRWLRRERATEVEIEHEHEHHHGRGHDHHHRDLETEGQSGGLVVKTGHSHRHKHVVTAPADPFTEYGPATSFGVGLIHGIGAEAPTQILLFATAAGLAGSIAGAVVLFAFVIGLFLGNTILAIASTAGSMSREKAPRVYMVLATGTALLSIYVGSSYLLGGSNPFFSPFGL